MSYLWRGISVVIIMYYDPFISVYVNERDMKQTKAKH